jgi:hypothetical protein
MNTREKGGGEYSDPAKAFARLSSGHQVNLQDQVLTAAQWPTPQSRDHFPAHSQEYIAEKKAQGHGMSNLNDVALWSTIRASDGEKGGPNQNFGAGFPPLPAQAAQSAQTWPTPTTRDHKDGSFCPNVPVNGLLGRMVWPTPTSLSGGSETSNPPGNSRNNNIRKHAMAAGVWQTPVADDAPDRLKGKLNSRGEPKLSGQAVSSGSSAPTEKRGALNPEFVSWLMGYPTEYLSCAPSETRSTTARRKRSSKPSCKP